MAADEGLISLEQSEHNAQQIKAGGDWLMCAMQNIYFLFNSKQ